MARSSSLGFVAAGMGSGSFIVCLVALASGGAALTPFLWVFALAHTTPTKVTSTITLNPLSASIAAAFLVHEPTGLSLLVGIATVLAGILIASSDRSAPAGELRPGAVEHPP